MGDEYNSLLDRSGNSGKARKKLRETLEDACITSIAKQLLPLLKEQFSIILDSSNWDLAISETDPLTILFQYPPSISYGINKSEEKELSYIKPVVRLEFGSRGDSFPTALYSVTPYVSDILPEIFDKVEEVKFKVKTLEANRTFWEKIIILHELSSKIKPIRTTIARHYYDTVMLFKKGIAKQAIEDKELLEKVVK